MKSYVKKTIARAIPNRRIQRTLAEVNADWIILDSDVHTLLPAIQQGDGQADREGTKVRIRKATLRLSYTSYADITAGHFVDLYIFKNKFSVSSPSVTAMERFLQSGNAAVQYTGLPLDGLRPVNEDLFTLKTHIRKRCAATNAYVAGTAIGSVPPMFNIVKDITKYLKKAWVYDDTLNYPTNDNLFICVGCSDMTGQQTNNYGEYTFCVDYEFESG